jgi:murein DD-endopeptidase MepM/ murein hydrolase activator NlpD
MKSPFLVAFNVTQLFGKRPEYYAKFGLAGHEGVDIVPIEPYWGIHAIAAGKVVIDYDNPAGRVYGDEVRIKEPSGRVRAYCHLSENIVTIGQEIAEGQLIGIMGDTGGSEGAHLHTMVYDETPDGKRLNWDNHFKGCLDPLSL